MIAILHSPALSRLLLFQVISGILVAPLFTFFPIYVERELHLPPHISGNIRGLFVVAGGAMAFFGGKVCDRLGRKNAYLLAMSAVVAAGPMFLLRSVPEMLPLALFAGTMFGLGAVAGQAYLMEAAPRESLALATAAFFMTGTVGNAVGSWIAGKVGESAAGFQILGLSMAVGHLLLMAAARLWLPEVVPKPREDADARSESRSGSLLEGRVLALFGLRFLPTFYWGMTTFLMPLVLFRLTQSTLPAGNYTSLGLVLAAGCQMAAGRWVDAVGPRVPVMCAVIGVTVGSLGQWWFAGRALELQVTGLLGSSAAWMLSVTMTTLIGRLSTPETRARLLGITHMFWSAGFLTGTLAGGYLGRSNPQTAFLAGGVACCLAVLCAAAVVSAASMGARTVVREAA